MAALSAAVAQAVNERRLGLRVPVGQLVRVFAGWRILRASLMQLSLNGCQLQCKVPIASGRSVWLWLTPYPWA